MVGRTVDVGTAFGTGRASTGFGGRYSRVVFVCVGGGGCGFVVVGAGFAGAFVVCGCIRAAGAFVVARVVCGRGVITT